MPKDTLVKTYAYGFPRLGKNREYKTLIEGYWSKKVSAEELQRGIRGVEKQIAETYEKYIDKFPSCEMTLSDSMLDTAMIFGIYKDVTLDKYFDLCRGKNALELTKWFNTNYHYLVPVVNSTDFKLAWNKFKICEAGKGIPSIIGPFTFLKLSKGDCKDAEGNVKEDYFIALAHAYKDLLKDLKEVFIEEPAFALELSNKEIKLIRQGYKIIEESNTYITLFTFYDSVDFLKDLYDLPIDAIGLDFINGKENFENIKKLGFPEDKSLIAGIVNGRNVWKEDIGKAVAFLKDLHKYAKNIAISNASPLYHLPVSLEGEELDSRLLDRLSFAEEKLQELNVIAKAFDGKIEVAEPHKISAFGSNEAVRKRITNLRKEDFIKAMPYLKRAKLQKRILNLPLFPTTTIGSFPQTTEVRAKRNDFIKGKIGKSEYKEFVKGEIVKLIKFQEDIGLDVLVHGEFERSDMVEFFAKKLDGIAATKSGWIISYGTRVYRPPIIFGDVSRPEPMSIEEVAFAQSLTSKPVKGMLTGPVTILAWSYVREDIPVHDVAYQIALCLQDEVKDYEAAGIKIVQIDEPAFRERAPIKRKHWNKYFDWAIKSFALASKSNPETQIHTHMCYSEFGEIIDRIVKLDFDVISLEATRSKGDSIKAFAKVNFPKQIGLGVWDIHSPAVPDAKDIKAIVKRVLEVLPKEQIWINPDCGLKTRGWTEIVPSLTNLIKVAKELRKTT